MRAWSSNAQGLPAGVTSPLMLSAGGLAAALPDGEAVALEPAQPRCCPNCGSPRLVYGELEPVAPGPTTVVAVSDSS
jgi:hypothetical protein